MELASLLNVPPLVVANYLLSCMVGVSMNADAVDACVPRRHSLCLYWVYFLSKATFFAFIDYALANGAGAEMRQLYLYIDVVTTFLTFVVLYYTWRVDLVRLNVMGLICEGITSGCIMGGQVLVRIVAGGPPFAFLDPLNGRMLVGYIVALVLYWALRRFAVTMLLWVDREMERHRALWFVMGGVLIFLTFSSANLIIEAERELLAIALFADCFAVLLLIPSLVLRLRDARLRERALRECEELSGIYDSTVQEQLSSLERDKVALEGNERTLAALCDWEEGSLKERIGDLEKAYWRLMRGSYCPSPGLDAVLIARVESLSDLGVRTDISVTGERTILAGLPPIVYTLLGIACHAAERMRDASGKRISLRVRPTDAGVLLRLETPRVWGPLNAKRTLRPFRNHGVVALGEYLEGDARVVKVLWGGTER